MLVNILCSCNKRLLGYGFVVQLAVIWNYCLPKKKTEEEKFGITTTNHFFFSFFKVQQHIILVS